MVGAVQRCPLNSHAVVSGLNDAILFGMEATAEFMSLSGRDAHLPAKAPDVQTVLDPGRGSIVPRSQNFLIFYENGTDLSPETGRSLGDKMGDIHEVFVPGGTDGMMTFLLFLFQLEAVINIP